MKLKGSVVLITGAAKRVGRVTAQHLASHGAHIVIHYRQSAVEANQLKKFLEKKYSVKAAIVKADLSQIDQVIKLSELAWKALGRVDVLVNNASTFYPTPLGKTKSSQWDDLMNVNAKAPYFLMEALGLKMKKRGKGKVINIADWAAKKPYKGYLPYCAAKAALLAVNHGMARSLAPQVQVNAILPGPVMWPDDLGEKEKKTVLKNTPLAKIGRPQDVASMVRFLIEEGDFMTGSEVHVDGGRHV